MQAAEGGVEREGSEVARPIPAAEALPWVAAAPPRTVGDAASLLLECISDRCSAARALRGRATESVHGMPLGPCADERGFSAAIELIGVASDRAEIGTGDVPLAQLEPLGAAAANISASSFAALLSPPAARAKLAERLAATLLRTVADRRAPKPPSASTPSPGGHAPSTGTESQVARTDLRRMALSLLARHATELHTTPAARVRLVEACRSAPSENWSVDVQWFKGATPTSALEALARSSEFCAAVARDTHGSHKTLSMLLGLVDVVANEDDHEYT